MKTVYAALFVGLVMLPGAIYLGLVSLLPLVLAYTGYCYYIFRGKASHESMY